MSPNPFTLSLSSDIQVNPAEQGYLLGQATGNSAGVTASGLIVPALPGFDNAIAHLREGTATQQQLIQTLSEQEGVETGEQLAVTLQQISDRGWLQYGVLPLAIAEPMVKSASLNLNTPHWTHASVSLSRFAYQRSHDGGMVLESPLSQFRVKLLDWRASAILAQLAQPQSLRRVTPPPHIGPETAYQFLNLLWATGFLSAEGTEAPELKLWEFHNLLFHSRCRQGRHDYPTGDIAASLDIWDEFPVVKPPMSGQLVPLPQLNIDAIRQRDQTLTTAIEKRQSIREYDENHPITIEQLGELLYRTARVKEIYTLDAEQQELNKAQFGPDFDWGELSRRPYPCGGAMYELEIYLAVRRCEGVNPGLYHYDPLNHQLAQIDAAAADIQALLQDAHQSSGEQGMPQVLLIITARFGRLFRKYRSLAYALVLKHVGVLYQNLYLVATNMGLAPCALGAGDSDRFAQATGLDYVVESSVGEFMLGSLPAGNVDPSGTIDASEVEGTTSDRVSDSEALAAEVQAEVEAASVGLSAVEPPSTITPSELTDAVEFPASTQPTVTTTASPISPASSDASTPPVSPSPQHPVPQHPHDLDDRIPGLADLRNQTLGDPRITIVILDGNPDHTLSCFEGAEISKVFPYWHPPADPVPKEAYLTFQEIDTNDDLDKDQKEAALKAAFPEPLLKRIHGDNHACHITSTIVGQENTPSPGLAPRCRVINVPLNTIGTDEEFISPLNLARAFELGLELGANIIHCAACRPTQTGEGEEILLQALKKCQDNNILIVAPAGNNKGECWCMPASLPGVLSVGALKPDGTPYKFSNWGGNNALEGIMAPGGEILGAQPANEAPVRLMGTSMAAPVMTGLCGLLMSLQLQQGKPVDAEAIRAALLNTAIPCTPDDTDEPERCLRGKVNLPGAIALLFGSSVTIAFAGDRVTRTEHTALAVSGSAGSDIPLGEVNAAEFDAQSTRLLNQRYLLKLPALDSKTSSFKLGCTQNYQALTVAHPQTSCLVKMLGDSPNPADLPNTVDLPSLVDLPDDFDVMDFCVKTLHAEQKALAALKHPHIIQLLDSGIDAVSQHPFHVLEWLDQTLDEVLNRYASDKHPHADQVVFMHHESWEEFYRDIGQPLLAAIAHCHQNNYVHRDLQPLNIMFTRNGQLKLIDFGLARHVSEDLPDYPKLNHSLTVRHPFFAPEPDNNELPFARDVFSFGLIVIYCFTKINIDTLLESPEPHTLLRNALVDLNIPSAIKTLLKECISPNPAARPKDANQLRDRFQELNLAFPGLAALGTDPHPHTSHAATSNSDSVPQAISGVQAAQVKLSTAHSGHVYALGTIGYDFGDEARRDTFQQRMAPVNLNGVMVPPDPYDARQIVEHLDRHPDASHSLIWTLNLDQKPIYALDPKGPFADDIYEMFLLMLNGQLAPATSAEFIERISIPARQTDRTVELFSGAVVPVVNVRNPRGMYGWNINGLVNAALATINTLEEGIEAELRAGLTAFLNRVYHDLHNLGQTSRDRALNFAVTNTFQAAATFADAIAAGRQLDTIEVEKSPYCRLNSDCWDILLTFFDPEDGKRSRQVFRFTIDVADNLPVTVGAIKRWAIPGKKA